MTTARLALPLLLFLACTKKPPSADEQWKALVQKHAIVEGEWEAAVRVLSVSRRAGLDAPEIVELMQKTWPKRLAADPPKPLAEAAANLRATITDVSTTGTIGNVAPAKDLGDLVGVSQVLLVTAKDGSDPALKALVSLADDMRKRGGALRATAAAMILKDAAVWSNKNASPIPALNEVKASAQDLSAAIAREVIATVQQIEKQEGVPAKEVQELRAFAVERISQVERAQDFLALRKVANWRDEPDAIDHPLIRLIARNWTSEVEDYERFVDALSRRSK